MKAKDAQKEGEAQLEPEIGPDFGLSTAIKAGSTFSGTYQTM